MGSTQWSCRSSYRTKSPSNCHQAQLQPRFSAWRVTKLVQRTRAAMSALSYTPNSPR